jgi:hypothetical protein
MRSSKTWRIELGEQRWAKFTYPRSPGAGLRLLGSITRGLQIGALAQTPDGRYVQVNGDHLTALSDAQVRRALRLVQATEPQTAKRLDRPERAVVVTIKRRRAIARPDADAPDLQARASAASHQSKASEPKIALARVRPGR